MNYLMSSKDLVIELEKSIPSCDNFIIISAFVTKPAISWLVELIENSSVCIVGRFSPKDFMEGASSIDAIRESLLLGYTVKCLPNLHAKIYQIDSDIIFTGSANMTGKGFSIVNEGNLEACAQVTPTDTSKNFIKRIVNSSIRITDEILDKMEYILDNFTTSESNDTLQNWPEDVLPKVGDLFVSDFPFSEPGKENDFYNINSSLEFAVIEAELHDFNLAQLLFKKSKAYSWFKSILIENNTNRDLGFGHVSSLLHDKLCDDPSPYRSSIKDLQANFYKYLALYAADEVEIYVPGRRSQVARLIQSSN